MSDNDRLPLIASVLLFTLLAAGCGGGGSEDGGEKAASPPPAANAPAPDPVADPDPEADPDPVLAPIPADAPANDTPPPASDDVPPPADNEPPADDDAPPPDDEPPAPVLSKGFQTIDNVTWDETAVRKVLRTFAYGGHASEEQIGLWADMPPRSAIVQMLILDEHNSRLSPAAEDSPGQLDTRSGRLADLSLFWSSDDPANEVPAELRENFQPDKRLDEIWIKAATTRGLNPFRQKIGLWETNYHMSVNLAAGISKSQMLRYYDDVMETHASGARYYDVLTTASTSAAVAMQYGHWKNRWVDDSCECNEDFAREFHQLFFGILGEGDADRHETVTIKNMAAALTDMQLPHDAESGSRPDEVIFGAEFHAPGTLEIMDLSIAGSTALERLQNLTPAAIEHEESLANLPVAAIRTLADDNLNDEKITQIRDHWAAMDQKYLLRFLRDYAVSTQFHSPDRVEYQTSIDRHLFLSNRIAVNDDEVHLDLYTPARLENDGVDIFRPGHNVFGGQTGSEAADSPDVFRNHWNDLTDDEWRYRRGTAERYGETWTKDWAAVIPHGPGGVFSVDSVATWLWNYLIEDGGKNYGALERGHLVALLATDDDLGTLVSPADPGRMITATELELDPETAALLDSMGTQPMLLDSLDDGDRMSANERVGRAINFIAGLPFIFVQEGR